jgi:hypothetical protein
MTAPRVAVVVLVLIAVLFFAGMGLGLRGEESGPANLDWIESLSGALTRGLDFDSLKSSCIDPAAEAFVLERKSTCQVSIPSTSRGTRRLALTLTEGLGVTGRFTAPAEHEKIDEEDQAADQEVTLEPGKDFAIVILKEGGTLSLTCDAAEKARCRVEAE